jgi:hypothetical protein
MRIGYNKGRGDYAPRPFLLTVYVTYSKEVQHAFDLARLFGRIDSLRIGSHRSGGTG